jgi:hemolysin activation/secretion protein
MIKLTCPTLSACNRSAFLTAAFLSASIPWPATAQDAGTLLRQQEQQTPRSQPEKPLEIKHEPIRTPPAEPGQVYLHLKSVEFTGASRLIPASELQAAVADAIGQDLDLPGLQQLADRITRLLKAKGWFLGRAYLPKQDVTSGALEIRVVAGQLSKSEPFVITPAGKAALRIDPERLRAIAAANLRPGDEARETDMERALLQMAKLPGITAWARIEPGTEPESTRVLIYVAEGPLLTSGLSLDNFGNRSTGIDQLNGQFNINNPLRIGDQLSLGLIHAEGTAIGRLNYSWPIGAQGTRLLASATAMNYEHIDGPGVRYGLNGTAQTTALSITHPLVISRHANLNLEAGASRKELEDNSKSGNLHDRTVKLLSLGLHGDRFDGFAGGGLNIASLSYSAGKLDLSGNASDAVTDANAYRTEGSFARWNLVLTRLQSFPGPFKLYTNLSGQLAEGNLGSSEQFILGGPYGVRAYPAGEAAGDSGWLANIELRYDLPRASDWGMVQLLSFYDAGHITLHKNANGLVAETATGRNEYTISGWGLGVNLNKPGSHSLRLAWSQKLGSNPDAAWMPMNGMIDPAFG